MRLRSDTPLHRRRATAWREYWREHQWQQSVVVGRQTAGRGRVTAWKKGQVQAVCNGGDEGNEPPVMKSAIRIPSSNLQPNLYISRYTLSYNGQQVRSESRRNPAPKTNRARENCEQLFISGYIRKSCARAHRHTHTHTRVYICTCTYNLRYLICHAYPQRRQRQNESVR